MSQRGNIALYLLFSLAVSTAVGYGVYALLRDRPRMAEAADEVPRAAEPRRVTPVGAPAAAPDVEPNVAPAVEPADRQAVAPADVEAGDEDAVLLGTPGVVGALEASAVERTMKRYHVRWERCMRRARERHEAARGDLRLAFDIAGDGSVARISYQATVEDALATCVTDVVKRLRFDRPADAALVKVVVPMRFVPARDGSDPLAR